jgi:hypothetical protein
MATSLGQVAVLFRSTMPNVGLSAREAIPVLYDLEGMSRMAVPVVSEPVPCKLARCDQCRRMTFRRGMLVYPERLTAVVGTACQHASPLSLHGSMRSPCSPLRGSVWETRLTSNQRGQLLFNGRASPNGSVDEFVQVCFGVVGKQVGGLGGVHHGSTADSEKVGDAAGARKVDS